MPSVKMNLYKTGGNWAKHYQSQKQFSVFRRIGKHAEHLLRQCPNLQPSMILVGFPKHYLMFNTQLPEVPNSQKKQNVSFLKPISDWMRNGAWIMVHGASSRISIRWLMFRYLK